MSLTQRVRLELDDGREIETAYDGRDLRAWEAKTRKSALVEPMSVGMLTWLGHHAAIRRGDLNGDLSTYEAFDRVCVWAQGISDKPEEVAPDPPKRSKASRKPRGDEPSSP